MNSATTASNSRGPAAPDPADTAGRGRVLVTGATGFVGSTLCRFLTDAGYVVRAALRSDRALPEYIKERVIVGDINSRTDWRAALERVDAVIHAAARVHVMHDSPEAAGLYAETNARGTSRLVDAAARAGVRRFIFLSTVKVNGEEGGARAYSAVDEPAPCDEYGRSKLQAEHSVRTVGQSTGLQTVIVRPPLVYGPGVRANFLRLVGWVDRERPLPLGAVANSRSLVSVWNLASLLTECLSNPAAVGRTFMVSDGEDLSTPELIRRIARHLGRKTRLIPVPVGMLRLAGRVTGRSAEIDRLCGSLTVDAGPTRELLGWSAPLTVDQSLKRTVDWYLSEGRSNVR